MDCITRIVFTLASNASKHASRDEGDEPVTISLSVSDDATLIVTAKNSDRSSETHQKAYSRKYGPFSRPEQRAGSFRDLEMLGAEWYELVKLQGFDMASFCRIDFETAAVTVRVALPVGPSADTEDGDEKVDHC
jgi:hypothetical protein